jgi:hypothetical protein
LRIIRKLLKPLQLLMEQPRRMKLSHVLEQQSTPKLSVLGLE